LLEELADIGLSVGEELLEFLESAAGLDTPAVRQEEVRRPPPPPPPPPSSERVAASVDEELHKLKRKMGLE
jgi:hypothetical protein